MTPSNQSHLRLRRALCGLAAAILCPLFGCPSSPHPVLHDPELLAPVALDAQLVLIDKANDRAVVLHVDHDHAGERDIVPLVPGSFLAARRNGAAEALVLALGRRAQQDIAAEPAALIAIDGEGQARRYTLGNPFDRFTQSDDGRYALLFKSGRSIQLLDNPNEIAIVDLSLAPEDTGAVTVRTLRSFGDSPANAAFSPLMMIAGEARRLAVILSKTNVTLLDLNHLDRLETTVQLSASSGQAVTPAEVIFHPSEPELYVRADSSDLYVFNLRERGAGELPSADGQPHNDFRPFIDQLAIGGQPSDVKTYTDGAQTRVLVLASSALRVSLVDPDRSEVTSVAMSTPSTEALLFEGASPSDRQSAPRALLYQPGANVVQFLDLVDLDVRGSRNFEALKLEFPVAAVSAPLDGKQVLVTHPSGGVSLIDLEARTVTLIQSAANLADARFDSMSHMLWFGPQGQPYIGRLDLTTGAATELLLDESVTTFVPVFASRRIAAIHDGKEGKLSLIDADNPTHEHTTTLRGFLR